jgi:hypothetical protein
MPKWGQSLTPTENVGRGFNLPSTLPAQSVNLIKWRCLHRVLCLVRSLVTALDCVLLKDKSLTLVPWEGPEINSRVCRWVYRGSANASGAGSLTSELVLFLRTCLETPKAGSGPINPEAEPLLVSSSAVSLPLLYVITLLTLMDQMI